MNNQTFQWSVWFRSRTGLITLAFLAIAAFYLITEHTAHVLGVLPFAIFLLCPLMMLFMHGGHGGHEGHANGHAPYERVQREDSTQLMSDHSNHSEEIK